MCLGGSGVPGSVERRSKPAALPKPIGQRLAAVQLGAARGAPRNGADHVSAGADAATVDAETHEPAADEETLERARDRSRSSDTLTPMAGVRRRETFYALVQDELDELTGRLREVGRSAHPTFAAAAAHLFGSPGKLLRPTLVFLAARFGPAAGGRVIVDLAESLELVHTASLVHDDIVDRAEVRRNVPTVNAVWDDDIALIVGDYLFAKAYALAAVLPKPEVIAMVAQTVFALCDGELTEVASPAAMPTEAEYLERIELKTASLYAACCQGAALLADADPDHVAALGAYGTNLGLAFQITDDVLDLVGEEDDLGKEVGRDLAEGMTTLPMIYAVASLDGDRAQVARRIVARDKDRTETRDLLALIRGSGGVHRAREKARALHDAALAALDRLPARPERDALAAIADFVIDRER
jgi:geranylgeranyl pyrophosphate synthase